MIDTDYFKNKLTDEKNLLEQELAMSGTKVGEHDWAASAPVPDTSEEDPTYQADRVEEFEQNVATINELEKRYRDVLDALSRIEQGTYGMCDVDGNEIELERLEANPAARTCIEHMSGESTPPSDDETAS